MAAAPSAIKEIFSISEEGISVWTVSKLWATKPWMISNKPERRIRALIPIIFSFGKAAAVKQRVAANWCSASFESFALSSSQFTSWLVNFPFLASFSFVEIDI